MLIMVGIIIYTFDLFGPYAKQKDASISSDVFNACCSLFGIIIISWLMVDIHKYLAWLRDSHMNGDEEGSFSGLKLIESENGELIISMPLVTSKNKKLPQYYCFTTGRHAGSFFLKIGAAIFCIGHIIHNVVIVCKNVIGYTSDYNDGKRSLEITLRYHLLSYVYSFPIPNPALCVYLEKYPALRAYSILCVYWILL